MNHIFLAREHLLVIYTETGEYPIPADHTGDKGIFDITNWPFDIMRVNETNCMVFADPNFMTSMGSLVWSPFRKIVTNWGAILRSASSKLSNLVTLSPYIPHPQQLCESGGIRLQRLDSCWAIATIQR